MSQPRISRDGSIGRDGQRFSHRGRCDSLCYILPSHHIPCPMRLNVDMGVEGNLSESENFAKVWPTFYTLITITFLQVLFIDYVLSRIENIKIVIQNCAEREIFSFHPDNDSHLPLKISDPPHTGFIFSLIPFLKPKKKKNPLDLPTPPDQSIYENSLSMSERLTYM